MDRQGVAVWDRFVRSFHWVLVLLVASAFLLPDWRIPHEAAGYAVLALVLARLVWGVVGSRHARFADFLASPATVLDYLRGLAAGRPRRYLGHNPAGGVMVLALLALLLIVAGSGWLSETDRFFGVEWVSGLHAVAANLLLALIVVHVLGVLVASLLHRENLISAMITGRKSVAEDAIAGEADAGEAEMHSAP